MSMERLRMEQAAKILAGFCANPSVFAPNPINGWCLVNANYAQLVGISYELADELLKEGEKS